MTGWRIGWMVVPEDQIRRVERLAQNMFICPPHASQVAALAALDCTDELEANRAVYAENRRLMLEGLPEGRVHPHRAARRRLLHLCRCLGPDRRQPALARTTGRGSWTRAGVAVTPGVWMADFDPVRGRGNCARHSVRFSYAAISPPRRKDCTIRPPTYRRGAAACGDRSAASDGGTRVGGRLRDSTSTGRS
jgi:aspartate/methionine/tyrosine aminotransferase